MGKEPDDAKPDAVALDALPASRRDAIRLDSMSVPECPATATPRGMERRDPTMVTTQPCPAESLAPTGRNERQNEHLPRHPGGHPRSGCHQNQQCAHDLRIEA
jgi:hypothetical protein